MHSIALFAYQIISISIQSPGKHVCNASLNDDTDIQCQLQNVLFAATNISLRDYTIGTALTLTKIALHVYIGANLTSFAKQFLDEEDDSEMTDSERRANTARTIAMIIGSVLATGVMIYIYIVAKRAVKEVEQEEQQDDQESLAFLSRQAQEDHDDASLEDWMEWHEDDDHSVELQARSRDVERG